LASNKNNVGARPSCIVHLPFAALAHSLGVHIRGLIHPSIHPVNSLLMVTLARLLSLLPAC
jgi:hypothetical protein